MFLGRKLICGISACQKHLGIAFFAAGTARQNKAVQRRRREQYQHSQHSPDVAGRFQPGVSELLHAAVELDADPTVHLRPKSNASRGSGKVLQERWPKDSIAQRATRSFAPTYQREYLVWLTMAETARNTARRLKETCALKAGRNGRSGNQPNVSGVLCSDVRAAKWCWRATLTFYDSTHLVCRHCPVCNCRWSGRSPLSFLWLERADYLSFILVAVVRLAKILITHLVKRLPGLFGMKAG